MARIVHTALVQFQPRKGEYHANLARLGGVFGMIAELDPRPDVVVFPESAMTGYFLEGGVRELACTAEAFAADLNEHYQKTANGHPLDIVAGFYEVHENTYYNSAIYVTLGDDTPKIVHVHRKVFLPTYGMFDEERFVEPGFTVQSFDTRWGRAAMLICEDAWHSLTATLAALDGAQVVFIPSASPARGVWPTTETDENGTLLRSAPASVHRWERIARDRAEEHGIYVAVAQLVGNEGGKAFAGGSVVAGPHGEVRTRGPLWEEAIIPVTIDLEDITRARADTPLLMDLRTMLPHVIPQLLPQLRESQPTVGRPPHTGHDSSSQT